jgi:apolipoprotein D and lipocalin family protein
MSQVVNRCRKERLDGKVTESKGKAEVVDTQTNAKLKVSFFWPFKGNYWIIDLDPDYRWAVVGEPSRKYLWILSRAPTMDESIYENILARLPEVGYDPDRLQKTA